MRLSAFLHVALARPTDKTRGRNNERQVGRTQALFQ